MFIPKFFRWGQCSFEDYQRACNHFGYNCESAPEFIAFKMRCGQSFDFSKERENDGERLR